MAGGGGRLPIGRSTQRRCCGRRRKWHRIDALAAQQKQSPSRLKRVLRWRSFRPGCRLRDGRHARRTSMKLTKTLLAIGLAQLALAAPVLAQSALEQIEENGALRIGTEGTYAPFTYHDSTGALVGFDVAIGRAIAERLGVEAEFVEGPWDGLIAGIDANRYDVVINQVGINEERQAKYDFSEPYIASKAALVVRADNEEIASFEDLAGKRAAQTLTSNYGKMAQEYGAEVVPTEGFDQSIALVLQGRADATINDSLSFFDFRKQQPD